MKILAHLFVILLFTGCAAKELLVKNADTMLEYQVNKRMPLTDLQKEKLARDIDLFLNSEKKVAEEILPVVDKINLEKADQVEADYQKLGVFYRKLSKDFSVLLAKYMVQLTPNQRQKFYQNLRDENRTFKRKTQEERREDAEERLEKFIGKITDRQRHILKSYDDYYTEINRQRLARRTALHAQFREVLESDSSTDLKEAKLLEAYLAHQDGNFSDSKVLEIISKFLPTLSPEQKEVFRDRTKEVKEILRYFVNANY